MQPTLCARCHKNMAVVFINRIENGTSRQEGLCLSCGAERIALWIFESSPIQ